MFTPARFTRTATRTSTAALNSTGVTSTGVTAPADQPAPSTSRRRILSTVVGLAIAAGALAAPQLTSTAAAATPAPSVATTTRFATTLLASLNTERSWNHEVAVRMNSKLILSAHRHDLTMAAHNVMSHQLPGEAFFATRITNAGYHWQAAGENIGWTSDTTMHGLYVLQHQMYIEKAPNNGHRLNILSHTFRDIGIYVYYDAAHHRLWFTQDFGHLAS